MRMSGSQGSVFDPIKKESPMLDVILAVPSLKIYSVNSVSTISMSRPSKLEHPSRRSHGYLVNCVSCRNRAPESLWIFPNVRNNAGSRINACRRGAVRCDADYSPRSVWCEDRYYQVQRGWISHRYLHNPKYEQILTAIQQGKHVHAWISTKQETLFPRHGCVFTLQV